MTKSSGKMEPSHDNNVATPQLVYKQCKEEQTMKANNDSLDASRGARKSRMSVDESTLLDASSSKVQRYIKELSSALSEPQELTVDEQLLAGVIREAGEYSFGVAAVEVYLFEDPRLVPVGIWRNTDNASTLVAPDENVPGVCLVGTLWADQSSGGMRRTSSVGSLVRRSSSLDDSSNSKSSPTNKPSRRNGLVWRCLETIMQDPDAIHGKRLKALRASGLEKAAGISFESNGIKGIVVYYAEEGVDAMLLSAVANEMFLRRTAELIGSILAMTESRRACVAFQQRYCRLEESIEKKEAAITCVEEETAMEAVTKEPHSCLTAVGESILTYLQKFRGSESQIPPAKPWDESLWTLFGAFCGLIVLSGINRLFNLSEIEYYVLIGPFGALMTLQYTLTAAPASQPRNVVLGQIVAGAVSLSFTYIPESVMPVWIRQAVAPAFAIAAMTKLGVPHPPAGAHSVIYAEGKHNWGFYGLVVFCSVVSIVPATIVNNLSQKRQYPIYWGYLPDAVARHLPRRNHNLKKEESESPLTDRSADSLVP